LEEKGQKWLAAGNRKVLIRRGHRGNWEEKEGEARPTNGKTLHRWGLTAEASEQEVMGGLAGFARQKTSLVLRKIRRRALSRGVNEKEGQGPLTIIVPKSEERNIPKRGGGS